MRIGVTDIEGNGLYEDIDTFHCAWIIDAVSGERKGYRPHQFIEYCEDLSTYDVAVLQNGIDFDFAALTKLNPKFKAPPIFDTLVLSRMVEPDRFSHGLKSWGKQLGLEKINYGADSDEDAEEQWEKFDEPMFVYCERDVEVTLALYKHLCGIAGFDYLNPPSSMFEYHLKDLLK